MLGLLSVGVISVELELLWRVGVVMERRGCSGELGLFGQDGVVTDSWVVMEYCCDELGLLRKLGFVIWRGGFVVQSLDCCEELGLLWRVGIVVDC